MLYLHSEALGDIVIVGLGDHRILSILAPGLKLRLGHDPPRPAILTKRHARDTRAVIAHIGRNGHLVNRLSPHCAPHTFQRSHDEDHLTMLIARRNKASATDPGAHTHNPHTCSLPVLNRASVGGSGFDGTAGEARDISPFAASAGAFKAPAPAAAAFRSERLR